MRRLNRCTDSRRIIVRSRDGDIGTEPARSTEAVRGMGTVPRPAIIPPSRYHFRPGIIPFGERFSQPLALRPQEDEMMLELLRIALHHAAEGDNAGSVMRTLARERVVR